MALDRPQWSVEEGGVVGTGFMITDDLMVTCAHVVHAAFGKDLDKSIEFGEFATAGTLEIPIDFPAEEGRTPAPNRRAQLLENGWHPVVPGAAGTTFEDFAVLKVTAAVPEKVKMIAPSRFQPPDINDEFTAFGFEGGKPEGTNASGKLKGASALAPTRTRYLPRAIQVPRFGI